MTKEPEITNTFNNRVINILYNLEIILWAIYRIFYCSVFIGLCIAFWISFVKNNGVLSDIILQISHSINTLTCASIVLILAILALCILNSWCTLYYNRTRN